MNYILDRRVGVLLPRDLPAAHIIPFAEKAEQLGFEELWIVEDCFFRGGIAQAAVVLASTASIHVGVGILPAAARNPAFATLEIATLAELFPGRLTVGLGHGMPVWMRQVGAMPASPLTMLDESVTAIKALLEGETVTVSGRYVSLDDVALASPPAVAPPILTGVRGPKSLALSGRVADGTILAEPVTPEYLAAAREQIAAVGDHRIVAYNMAAIDDDADAARLAVRSSLEWIGDPDWVPHILPLPFAAEFAKLRADTSSREEFGRQLPDEWVDTLSLAGTPQRVRARIAELQDAGAHSVVLIPTSADPLTELHALARVL